jgi:hypothetical protein
LVGGFGLADANSGSISVSIATTANTTTVRRIALNMTILPCGMTVLVGVEALRGGCRHEGR